MLCNLARAAAIAAALLASVPAIAGGEKAVKVSYADLDLASAHGKAAFDRRIAAAAQRLCGPASQLNLVLHAATVRCVAATIESAQPAVQLAHRDAASQQLAARDVSVTVAP